ncbi:MAG: hypothetical protein H0Z18_08975 [Thermococcus sp.]|uniref:hypothetical protein n=1 Tax=Thermococcus sp. TaxID=35749 RepID=UPI001DEC5F8C|nr:hypothetical protein [Thermococcus sp.]MBO8175375.1 hypothetical protein [Thermococcus sp.]
MKKRLAVLMLVSLLGLAIASGCIATKPPTKESVVKAIEDVDKYEFWAESKSGEVTTNVHGGVYYSQEEGYWEIVIKSEKEIRYVNETLLKDMFYYSYVLKAGGRKIEGYSEKLTVEEYFNKYIVDSSNLTNPEEVKWEILKGPYFTTNPLNFIKDLLQHGNITKIEKTDKGYIVEFVFKKVEKHKAFGTTLKITIEGSGKLLIKGALPMEAELIVTKISKVGDRKPTISNYTAKVKFSYRYKRPEWVREVTEK